MKEVRFGVIGVGGMGRNHCKTMAGVEGAKLAAVCDVVPETAQAVAKEYGVKGFTDYRKLIDSGACDAVLIATPHYQHPPIGVYAFRKGLHVLCEKPIAVTVKAADRLVAAARRGAAQGLKFACMFQFRTSPVYQKAKQLIDEGAIGELYRTDLQMAWLRTQSYYDSGAWRGTWKGEGGGVLLNQGPHCLDMFVWLGGLPSKVTATWRAARHKIEVEDEVYALLEYPNGARGLVYASVNEVPQFDNFAFSGDKGRINISRGKLELHTVEPGIREFIEAKGGMWGSPNVAKKRVRIEAKPTGHGQIMADFVRAILHGESLLAPGEEALGSLELSNAIMLSGHTGRPVQIPVDRDKYEDFLAQMRNGTKRRRK